MTIDPIFLTLICYCFALLFGLAGAHKLSNRSETQTLIDAYNLVPAPLLAPASLLVPILELAIGAGLMFGATRSIAVIAGGVLLIAYGAAMAINLYRGKRDLDCGCSFGDRAQKISPPLVYRNALLATLIFMAAMPVSNRETGMMDAFIIAVSLIAASILYAAANTLIENQTKQV